MTCPCEVGLVCSHCVQNVVGWRVCVHPYTDKDAPDRTWPMVKGYRCPLVRWDSPLEGYLDDYEELNRGDANERGAGENHDLREGHGLP